MPRNVKARTCALERLRGFRKVRRIFLFRSCCTDHFRVVVPDDDLAVNDELADLYWDVVERYPDYDFRIEPVPAGCFDESSVPVSAVEVPIYNDSPPSERKERRDIRTVAGAWKGHEELRRELEEERD